MKHLVVAISITIFVIFLILILQHIWGNHKYYENRDSAIALCRGNDIEAALKRIQIAISYAKDQDLINEGLHYRQLFEYGVCDE